MDKQTKSMQDMEKALQGIAKVVDHNESVEKITVKIEFKKQKPSKAKPKESK